MPWIRLSQKNSPSFKKSFINYKICLYSLNYKKYTFISWVTLLAWHSSIWWTYLLKSVFFSFWVSKNWFRSRAVLFTMQTIATLMSTFWEYWLKYAKQPTSANKNRIEKIKGGGESLSIRIKKNYKVFNLSAQIN